MAEGATEQRKLAAIMFTDMVGYSALSQRNDNLAQELLEEHRTLLRTIFPRFNGHEIKTIGDAFLIEFHSALEAAQCGIEIQRALAKRNHDVPAERRIEIKIGIHIGDVVHRDGDVYGDGVNIASRIEPLAGAGGICVSMDVERQIRNALEARFEKLAPTELKNISVTMDLFRIVLPWESRSAAPPPPPAANAAERPRNQLVKILAVVGGLAIGAWGLWTEHHSENKGSTTLPQPPPAIPAAPVASTPVADAKSIAVLPFVNMSADKTDEYLSDGISEELITALSKISGLQVKARTSSFAFKGKNEDIESIGQQLHVSHLLEGSVARSGNKLRITAQLIKVLDGNHLWSDTYDRDMQDIFAVRSEVAEKVVAILQIRLLGDDRKRMDQKPTGNLEAYNLYRQGRFHATKLTEEGFQRSLDLYRQAIEKDPGFALAYTGMADTYVLAADEFLSPREAFPKAKDAALKAIELDDSLAEAHASMGYVHYHYDWDWTAADREFKRAVELNPQSALIRSLYTQYLAGMRRFDEAFEQGRRAVETDPLSLHAGLFLGRALFQGGHADEATEQFTRILELDPNNVRAHVFLGRIYSSKGMQQRAAAELETARNLAPGDPVAMANYGYCQGVMGRRGEALKVIESFDSMEKQHYVSRTSRAFVYAGLGDKDKVFEWLEKAYQERSDGLTWIRNDPELKSLQADPRFATLMRKIGFTEP